MVKTVFTVILWIVVGIMVLLIWLLREIVPEESAVDTDQDRDPTAGMRQACRMYIEQVAHNPSSLDWINFHAWATEVQSDGMVSVRAEYRAENAFGGTIREVTWCDLKREDGSIFLVDFR